MSKIPVAKGGFRSWLSKNDEKPTKSVLYETKFQEHHDRIRNKENSVPQTTTPMAVSMANPRPSSEDFAAYDEDRRLREHARNVRVNRRLEENSARSSLSSKTPERASPSNDQYFTPSLIPETPEKSIKSQSRSTREDRTPTRSIEHREVHMDCLNRRLDQNFAAMQEKIFAGKSVQQARLETIAHLVGESDRSPRSSERKYERIQNNTILVTRSSSQPPPLETIERTPESPRKREKSGSRVQSPTAEPPVVHTSFVETLVTAHRLQRQFAERSVIIREQMSKAESIRILQKMAYSEPPVAPPRAHRSHRTPSTSSGRMSGGSDAPEASEARKPSREDIEVMKKWRVIKDIKQRIGKINDVQSYTHKLVSDSPYSWSIEDQKFVRDIDSWIGLPFEVFDKKTARHLRTLNLRLNKVFERFRNVQSMFLGSSLNNSQRSYKRAERKVERRLSSSAMRISQPLDDLVLPAGQPFREENPPKSPPMAPRDASSPPLAPRPMIEPFVTDAATQITARSTRDRETQMTSRIEKLDLSSLETSSSSAPSAPPSAPPISAAQKRAEIDAMLDGIQLLDTSLETLVPEAVEVVHQDSLNMSQEFQKSSFHFMKDISFPLHTNTPDMTPRSARTSLDSASARRLSAGVAFYLEQYKKEQGVEGEAATASEQQEKPVQTEELVQPTISITSPTDSPPGTSALPQPEAEEKEEEEEEDVIEKESTAPTLDDESDPSEATESSEAPLERNFVMPYWENYGYDGDVTQFEHEREEEIAGNKTSTTENASPSSAKSDSGNISDKKSTSSDATDVGEAEEAEEAEEEEDEGDETKQFRNHDEFEDTPSIHEEPSGIEEKKSESMMDESADDSMFLLNDKPAPKLKSILDNVPSTPTVTNVAPVPSQHADTPRAAPPAASSSNLLPLKQADVSLTDDTYDDMDMEEYCRTEFLDEMGPVMIGKALEHQAKLRGVDWIDAQDVWQPPNFESLQMDNFYDHFDFFDSFSMLLWGAVVELFNKNYAKFNRQLTKSEEKEFEEEAREMMRKDFGQSSKEKEWCRVIELPKKLEGMNTMELDYRFDVRRMLPENEKKAYQYQQMQMKVLDEKFGRKELEDQLNQVYLRERENLGYVALEEVAEKAHPHQQVSTFDAEEDQNDPRPINDSPVRTSDV